MAYYYVLKCHIHVRAQHLVLGAIIYFLNPFVSFNDILGFHPECLILPCVFWAYVAFRKDKFLLSISFVVLIALVSEQWIAFCSSLTFGFGILARFQLKYIFCSIGFFLAFIIALAITLSQNQHGANLGAVLTPPNAYQLLFDLEWGQLVKQFLEIKRLFFFYFMALPFLCFFLLLPFKHIFFALIAMAPDFLKIVASSEPLHYAVDGHYSAGILSIMLLTFAISLERINFELQRLRALALVASITASFAVVNSALPISIAFWTPANAGNFMFTNYIETEKSYSLSEVSQKLATLGNIKSIQATNGAVTSDIVQRNGFDLFPTQRYEDAHIIVIEKRDRFTSGASNNDNRYTEKVNTILADLALSHLLIFETAHHQIWQSRSNILKD